MKTIRWGIIGCGDVTEVKSGPGFQLAKNSQLVAVMRRNGELAKDYATRHNVPKWYDNAEELINDPDVDVVYIATPPAFHKEYTLKCAEAGKPVYVEKPMARNFEECTDMIQACENAGVPLFVAYYRRALDRFNKVKELIDSGEIGEIRFVTVVLYKKALKIDSKSGEFPWRVIPEISGGGEFMDLASHTLDVLDYILGPIKEACGYADNQAKLYEAEDIVTASLAFESGVKGTGTWCFSSFSNYDMNEIVGSLGKISFSTFEEEPVLLTTIGGTTSFNIKKPVHIQTQLIQSIVNEINGLDVCKSTGISGARTNKIMDQILRSYRLNKK
ncbi:Gfo/Idh/MocA family protein [Clostridium estertheticum]|uniref:Oxidoreductase n=2 Tax=Clostridium estertheticum TaxID=238834 RepID=A0A1J0GJZ7_9CLOT|nr:Gfo/Idh/MocA family oxidoreductase [Clostridium estertheticum]APC41607.1 oxidoreductase [Clostridium estertheticum subsp. estertheticum]MBW9169586.1 Gfo/Idh/MocA family oxidoreductase [Clostridium estertheticum]MBX4262309.1 Gfo/Idh/MocA family oxidoreductase [Clostridium estertheticum]MBZ9616528.1 Gfo/Idh/MocA family oxidoreductase [Clostridium estertheticum subsp. laramiense]MCB2341786.1 Gfo/Idh/MocA family oxidoreductase [Clostridium estertheticum]